MRFPAIPLLIFICFGQDASEKALQLVEALRSDKVEERMEAAAALRALGKAALPILEKAAGDSDPEVASRARGIARAIAIREQLPSELLRVVPGIDDLLASGGKSAWASAFLKATERDDRGRPKFPSLSGRDLGAIAPQALQEFSDPTELERICREISARRVDAATEGLVPLLRSKTPGVAEAASAGIAALEVRSVIPALVEMLQQEDSDLRRTAILLLGKLDAKEASPLLRDILRSKDSPLRMEALEALGRLEDKDAVSDILAFHSNAEYRVSAVQALSRIGDSRATLTLIHQLSRPHPPKEAGPQADEKEEFIRILEVTALRDLGARDQVPFLLGLLKDSYRGVRMSAALALGKLGSPQLRKPLEALLNDPEPWVRGAGIEALVGLRCVESAPEIAKLLDDVEWGIRTAALIALARLEVKTAAPALVKLLADNDGSMRATSAYALGILGAGGTARSVRNLLEDKEWTVVQDAAQGLARLGDREAVPRLRELLRNAQEPDLVESVVDSLLQLGVPEADPALTGLLEHADPKVQVAAARGFLSGGSRVGVPTLLRDSDEWSGLNRLRRPAAWQRLEAPGITKNYVASLPDALREFGKDFGLRIVHANAADETGYRTVVASPGVSWSGIEVLKVQLKGRYEYVLEDDSLVILSVDQAREFWRKWWEAERPK